MPKRPPKAQPSGVTRRSAPAEGRPVEAVCRHPRLRAAPEAIARALHTLERCHDTLATAASVFRRIPPQAPLSVVFVTDAELAALHGRFLDDPSLTDVITFPGDPAGGPAGEICVSADAAVRQAGRGFAAELTLYLVHGWLHLAGHDDLRPSLKRRMRSAERRALRILGTAEAMPRFTMRPKSR